MNGPVASAEICADCRYDLRGSDGERRLTKDALGEAIADHGGTFVLGQPVTRLIASRGRWELAVGSRRITAGRGRVKKKADTTEGCPDYKPPWPFRAPGA